MNAGALTYQLPHANWSLQFSDSTLRTLRGHVQRWRWSKESVGQIFTKDLTSDCVVVDRVTVLTPTWAAWSRVRFDTKRAMDEREALFEQGLHCIGLWHTHPEPMPTPSAEDRMLAREHALAARPQLSGIVFVIVGTCPPTAGLCVWVDDGRELYEALALPAGGSWPEPNVCLDDPATPP
jgi:proteasome lid subunit RPN8/RPN11